MADIVSNWNQSANSVLKPLLSPHVKPVLVLFLVLYGSLAVPNMPPKIKAYANTFWFKLIFLSMLLWIGDADPGLAIAAAVMFMGVINVTAGRGLFESFSASEFEGPATAIYPGCMNMTVYDLLESFKNDKDALMNAMLVSRVPGNVTITDYYAPLIATYLLNKGFALKAPCAPPGVDQHLM